MNKFILIGFGAILGAFFYFSFQTIEIEVFNPRVLETKNSPPLFYYSQKIQEAKELLSESSPLKYETKSYISSNKKIIKTNELVRKQIALAILDTSNGNIIEKRVWVKENDINNYSITGNITLENDDPNEKLSISVRYWNSFNSFFEISNHADYIVIGNKYLIANKYLGNLPEKSKNSEFSEIIYVPYSTALHNEEMISAGREYLRNSIESAINDLNKKNIASLSMPGKPVTSVVSKDFLENIILVEHVDPDLFKIAPDGGKELVERVLIILGSNREKAYRYTGSPAGANGLAQFIKSTYDIVYNKYPDANLLKSYDLGMADHVNAVKAMVLFFDIHKKEIEDRISLKNFSSELGITEEMLAAAYNGGPKRVIDSVNKYGAAWISQQFSLPEDKRSFRQETIEYIKKFWFIRSLN